MNYRIIIRFHIIDHHRTTVTSQCILWNTQKWYILVTRMLISRLKYSWWFSCMSKLLLSNQLRGWFSDSVLPITKVRGKFWKSSIILLSFWPAWRRLNYQKNSSVSIYLSSQNNCNHSLYPVEYSRPRSFGYKTWSSLRRPIFLHALSFECTSKPCINFLNQFSVYFHI